MRCFDPVWRLNLIAINLKNIHRNKLIQILYGKAVYTRVFSGFKCFPDTKFPQTFPDSKFSDPTRTENEKVYYRICRCVCKQQHKSGSKTFRFRDGSNNFRFITNVLAGSVRPIPNSPNLQVCLVFITCHFGKKY
jgi:hypothetical protein